MTDTKKRILDIAERLFAEQGYAGTSLRAIIAEAGVNLSAVHYHFHSKEALLEAVVLRRAIPANQERLMLLERCEREAGDDPPEIEKIIEAFVAPAFHAAQDPARGGPVFRRLMGRLYAEGDILPRILISHFGPLLARFAGAMERSVPELSREELLWRAYFSMGAVAQALRGTRNWEILQQPLLKPHDSDAVLERLLAFLSAAFRAPVGTVSSSRREANAPNDAVDPAVGAPVSWGG